MEVTALGLTKDAMEYLNGIGRTVGTEGEDALGPLRRALGRVASLGEAVATGPRGCWSQRREGSATSPKD